MKLATIEKIHSIIPHPNADNLVCALIKAWPVVIRKNEFVEGQLIVFISIDSIVPKENSYFNFMERQHYRVWSAKFRKCPSQGLVCPLSILPTTNIVDEMEVPVVREELKEGDDVTQILNVTKYEKPLDLSMTGDAKGRFPTNLVSITDEENLLNFPDVLNEFDELETYITVKADGSSMTVIYHEGEVRVCSRRLEQKEGTGFWQIANLYDLPNKLKVFGKPLAIQAEACGGKIQGNPMGLNKKEMFVFNVKELDTGILYGYKEIKELCYKLDIPMVRNVVDPFIFTKSWDIPTLQQMANGVVYLTEKNEIKQGEGMVMRPVVPKYSGILGHPLSVKILNQNY